MRVQTDMTTIPARLARLTQSSPTWDVARQRSRSLYRMWYRSAPEICQLYALNIPAHAIRAKVREEFEKNKHVDDIKAVDVLLLKGYQEYQETLNCWKMDSHLMRWFAKEEVTASLALPLFFFWNRPADPTLSPRTQLPRKYSLSSKSMRAQRTNHAPCCHPQHDRTASSKPSTSRATTRRRSRRRPKGSHTPLDFSLATRSTRGQSRVISDGSMGGYICIDCSFFSSLS